MQYVFIKNQEHISNFKCFLCFDRNVKLASTLKAAEKDFFCNTRDEGGRAFFAASSPTVGNDGDCSPE